MTDPPPARGTTLAVGGHRHIPAPDPIAHDYLLLVLRIDQHIPGLIDGYFGPADLKARSDIEELRPAPRLVDDAAALLERIASEVPEADRHGTERGTERRGSERRGGAGGIAAGDDGERREPGDRQSNETGLHEVDSDDELLSVDANKNTRR